MDAQAEHQGLKDALRAGTGAEWEAGRHWKNIVKHRLFTKLGCSSATDYIEKKLEPLGLDVPSPATMARWGAVGFLFSKTATVAVGMNRLVKAVSWWKGKGKTDFSRTDPGSEPIQIPVLGGAFATKPLQACTIEELDAAIAALNGTGKGGLSTGDAAIQALAQGALGKFVGTLGPKAKGTLRLAREQDDLYLGLNVYLPVGKLASLLGVLKPLF